MRKITYIHQLSDWPKMTWDDTEISPLLAHVRHQQGRLLGRMSSLGFDLQTQAAWQVLTLDVIKSSEIEGQILNTDQVRSSVARRLGLKVAGLVASDRYVDGVVEMMLDATQNFTQPLTKRRLLGWQAALFPTGYSGLYKVKVGAWRDDDKGPMQVVSGALGRERVHFEAPAAIRLEGEIKTFLDWFNRKQPLDDVLKSALAHFWFVTIHPFDDGNGRVARALADLQLARSEGSALRYYSMSAQIQKERNAYYNVLESTQKAKLNITPWLTWYLGCLDRALSATAVTLQAIIAKAQFWETHRTTSLNHRQHQMLNKLLDGFEGKLTSSKWAKIAKCSPDTALRDIQDLVERKVLRKAAAGGRSTAYELRQV